MSATSLPATCPLSGERTNARQRAGAGGDITACGSGCRVSRSLSTLDALIRRSKTESELSEPLTEEAGEQLRHKCRAGESGCTEEGK